MDKTIINYCTSGLGNRLRSLASCHAISKYSGRQLKIYWDNITPNGCLARFDELFKNPMDTITLSDMENLDDCFIVCDAYDAQREFDKFGRKSLASLVNKYGCHGKDSYNQYVSNKNIVVFNNNFLNNVNTNEALKFLKELEPINEIQEKIQKELARFKEIFGNEKPIGIHARGSDFGIDIDFYLKKIDEQIATNPNSIFFLISDDKNYEKAIIKKILDSECKVLTTEKQTFTEKINSNDSWQNHNNFELTKEHVQDAVMEMFLLSKTNIKIFHENSTFCQIARIIGNQI